MGARWWWRWLGGKAACKAEPSPLHQSAAGPFVFIHINKTAGTSIGKSVGLRRKQHLTAREVIALIGRAEWDRAFRFTIVRNPWDKVVSHYKHRVRTNQTNMGAAPPPFPAWVAGTYGPVKDPRFYDNPKMFLPQVEWLRDDRDQVDYDVVGRFEELQSAFRLISARLGGSGELPHLNATEKDDYRTYYDPDAAAAVDRWFRDDIERFGYTFDGGG